MMPMTSSKNNDSDALRQQLAQMQEVLAALQQDRDSLQQDRDSLQKNLTTLKKDHEVLRGEHRVVRIERDLLKERFDAAIRRLFAAKSEARSIDQKDLFFDEAELLTAVNAAQPAQEDEPEAPIDVPAHQRAKRGRKPLDPALPREVVRIELPEDQRVCGHDGTTLTEIGVEVSERINIIPQQVNVIRTERVKYACPCCDQGMRVAPAPLRLIPKGLFTESALAWIATAKYQDGMPIYRLSALLGRFGGTDLSRNTMGSSMVKAGASVQPIINLLRDTMLESDLIYGDETELQVLKEPGRAAQSKSYMWVQMSGSGPPIRIFTYQPSRSGASALALYAGAKPGAVLMSDGYEVYNAVARTHELVHIGCWAHARRRFVEAEAALPRNARTPDQPATQFMAAIATLYRIEARAKDSSPEERLRLRQEFSKPALERIEALLLAHQHTVMPGSALGQAVAYLAGQWPKLVRFVDNGTYPIDNNVTENAIRPFVIGRKGWLFSDTVGGANASANLYSLVETCKANQIEPYRYLCALFKALPYARTADDYQALLPWNIKLHDA
jgi:transposase